ncbi:MAG: amidohydrolase [Carnobacterium sp.]|uniref:Amidohydrolase n=1 Tax=Carnobacterium antarcticum TaxID=2126436 RepID=A0ABW4NL03_9LACT|nr:MULTISPECIES: amidohydrolase [unclassified Carnobacterium]ALV22427.1 Catalyzes the cleavage of p-aminobenzoyl-glutamate to p-aminobenzoate and glutamate, subunit A [Carnobacterium sp. CP1]QQP70352.1 amidohydrolase [Carnobacterium sp. CS13]
MREKLMTMLEARKEEMIAIRRHLHAHPELSYHEEKTAAYIADFYQRKAVDVQTDVGGNAVIVTINDASSGDTLALRADFDALPIEEETGLPFASTSPGVMHACGHDAHTAYLMVLADCLIELKAEIPGTIKVIHQHGEEAPPGGAKFIMETEALADVDHIIGIHVFPDRPAGEVAYRSGAAMAGGTQFKLIIQGVGGHGSSPHKANDAIVAGAYFVTTLQTILSRRVNPFEAGAITVGSFDGKGSFNVINDAVTLEGDMRYMTTGLFEVLSKELHQLVNGLEELFGVQTTLTLFEGCPPVYNDPELTSSVVDYLTTGIGDYLTDVVESPMLTGNEDFAYYTQKIPGCFFYIGCRPKGIVNNVVYDNHHPKFDIDEEAISVAAKAVGEVVCGYFGIE